MDKVPEAKAPMTGKSVHSRLAKTMKREVAVCGLLFWAVIVGHVAGFVPATEIAAHVQLLNVITWPIWAYAAGAFGLDAWQKQRSQLPHHEATE